MKIYEDSALTLVIKSEQGEKQYFSVLFLTGNTKKGPCAAKLIEDIRCPYFGYCLRCVALF